MSDLNLQTLAKTLTLIWGRVADERSPFELSRTAMAAVRKAIGGLAEAQLHDDWSAGVEGLTGLLVNLRANLTPGLSLTTGNPGSDFDPAVELAARGVIQSSDVSDVSSRWTKLQRLPRRSARCCPAAPSPRRTRRTTPTWTSALGRQARQDRGRHPCRRGGR